jgi:hypothetical protein
MQATVVEQFIMSKTGTMGDCEDSIYIGPHFIAVIDGSTSMAPRRWNGQTGGRVCAHIISQVFAQLPFDATARQAVDAMTSTVQNFYQHSDTLAIMEADPVQRIAASVIALSLWRQEIWSIGDCQCLIDAEWFPHDKLVDHIISAARALFLQSEILQGVTTAELCQNDSGRKFILPLLERQSFFQNNPTAGKYWYAVIDGFPVPDEGIMVREIPPETRSIVLATDGYPILKERLEESENALHSILLEDPLLIGEYKSTKGMRTGNVSFDDRTFVKVRL